MPGHVQFGIVTIEDMIEDMDGRTKLTENSVSESVKDGEAMLTTGMIEGWAETVDRLARLVEKK